MDMGSHRTKPAAVPVVSAHEKPCSAGTTTNTTAAGDPPVGFMSTEKKRAIGECNWGKRALAGMDTSVVDSLDVV